MRSYLTRFLALGLLAATLPACAERLVDVKIVDRDGGDTLIAYPHHGRRYVAGVPGQRYAVRLVNRTGGRVLAVLSVDGVNAVTGETASPDQAGYVLAPYESAEIAGWRKSGEEIAQFYFTRLPDSYAARTDRPENVGVIGVAAFREMPAPPPMPETFLDGAQPGAAARGPAPAQAPRAAMKAEPIQGERLGTGHGAREYAPVEHTSFERATRLPGQVIAIRYDSPANLAAMGILPPPSADYPVEPRPFPGHYVPDPYH